MIMQIVNIYIEISRNSDLCNFTFESKALITNLQTPRDKISDKFIWHYILAFKNQDLTRLNKNFTAKNAHTDTLPTTSINSDGLFLSIISFAAAVNC